MTNDDNEEDRIIGEIAGRLIEAAMGGADADELTAIEKEYCTDLHAPARIRNAERRAIDELKSAARRLERLSDASFRE